MHIFYIQTLPVFLFSWSCNVHHIMSFWLTLNSFINLKVAKRLCSSYLHGIQILLQDKDDTNSLFVQMSEVVLKHVVRTLKWFALAFPSTQQPTLAFSTMISTMTSALEEEIQGWTTTVESFSLVNTTDHCHRFVRVIPNYFIYLSDQLWRNKLKYQREILFSISYISG